MAKRSITVDMSEIRKLEKDLSELTERGRGRALRTASAIALTRQASDARRYIRDVQLEKTFVIRNRWTKGAIRMEPAKFEPIHRQKSRVGAVRNPDGSEHYLALQATGGELPATGPNGRRLTTGRGSGEGLSPKPRRKTARRRFRPGKPGTLNLAQRIETKGMSDKQRAFVTVKRAREEGEDLVWLELPGSDKQGIFDVTRPKIRMVHRVYRDRLRVKRHPWLQPAVERQARVGLHFYREALLEQIKKRKLFRK